jgi:isoquinoline 1-oxidoreductase subunit alpha
MTTITINGQARTVDVDPTTPLLWYLRDTLDLTGTKYGCGMALCGACTVHLDGQPVRSCSVPVSAADGKKVVTIEALAGRPGEAVRAAWQKLDVVQCGYCQSGQMMSAAALLATNANPSDDQIDAAMNGNLCRCATYLRIRAAIHEAARTLGGAA